MIYLDNFVFPSLPERISVNLGTIYQSYSLMTNKISVPNGADIKSIKWSGVFFGKRRRHTVLVQDWGAPQECIAFLEEAIKNKATMNLIVEEAPINLEVTVSIFSYEAAGAFGDIEYTIELQEAGALKVYTVSEQGLGPLGQTVEIRPDNVPAAGQMHTIVSGGNLWRIARKYYGGSGGDWKKIYDANVEAIEEAAKNMERPRRIMAIGFILAVF